MRTVLFIGNFISKARGSITPVEDVMSRLEGKLNIIKASRIENSLLRVFDMIFKTVFVKYDVIHIDTYSTNAIYFAAICAHIAKIRNKNVVLNLRGGELYVRYSENTFKSKVIKITLMSASKIVSPSLYLKSKFKKTGIEIEYLPNYVDNLKFPFRKEKNTNHRILWVRAFAEIYMPDLAVRILYELKNNYKDATLTMIGPDHGEKLSTEKLVRELNLVDSVKIEGKKDNNELSTYYSTHSVFINTTKAESFGLAVMESAFSGLPVVSTSVGELPYLWKQGEEIMLVETFNAVDFANSISKLFADKVLYEKIKIGAFSKSQLFTWSAVEPMWIKLLIN